ncbi:MAG: asparagine--tRNA ligase [Verrucomicrobiota bacterium]
MKRDYIKDLLQTDESGIEVTVAGWVRTRRDSKAGFSFIELNDGSCFSNLQIVAGGDLPNYESEVKELHPGASVRARGQLVESKGRGQKVELQASEVKVFGFCEPTEYPLGKQKVSLERLREVAHLRPRSNTFGAVMRIRNALAYATHIFFQERNFLYVHTPIITTSDCEGAGEMFQVTSLDLQALAAQKNDKEGTTVDYAQDFFGRPASLTVSGQLEAETYACALGNVYTFGPTFRAENSNTRRHLAEFWMVEPEMAFADLNDDADLAEDYVQFLFKYVLEHCQEDLQFLNDRMDNSLIETLNNLAASQCTRLTYNEAIEILADAPRKFDYPAQWGADLQSEHERYLAEEVYNGPVTVTDFPKDIKAFYMRMNDDGKTVAALDLLLPKVGEIIGGSQREERLPRLEERIREFGFSPEDYWWYCDLRRFGSVPHAGFGLGFERIVQFCTGMHNIRDVIPFPRTPKNAEF